MAAFMEAGIVGRFLLLSPVLEVQCLELAKKSMNTEVDGLVRLFFWSLWHCSISLSCVVNKMF